MMFGKRQYLRIIQSPWNHRDLELAVGLVDYDAGGEYWELLPESNTEPFSPLKWVKADMYRSGGPVGLRFEKSCGQQLIDDLWAAGIRPTDMPVTGGVLEANRSHIEDLRTLLFHKEGITKTEGT